MATTNNNSNNIHYKRLGREFALQFLFQHEVLENKEDLNSDNLHIFWQQVSDSEDVTSVDQKNIRKGQNFAKKLITGILENFKVINDKIAEYSIDWSIDRMAIIDRNVLRLAIFEMLFMDDIPPIVSIDEAVTIAKEFSSAKAATFINGVLNSIKDNLDRPPREANK
ncbi:transcription antitermination factor NusB [Lentisphaerota bacterium WC36G]|nr:transcription antitermination factor NusB [Lentisphaerae bacterium WC36]